MNAISLILWQGLVGQAFGMNIDKKWTIYRECVDEFYFILPWQAIFGSTSWQLFLVAFHDSGLLQAKRLDSFGWWGNLTFWKSNILSKPRYIYSLVQLSNYFYFRSHGIFNAFFWNQVYAECWFDTNYFHFILQRE